MSFSAPWQHQAGLHLENLSRGTKIGFQNFWGQCILIATLKHRICIVEVSRGGGGRDLSRGQPPEPASP